MYLNSSDIGCCLGTAFINYLCYAEDLCLISSSSGIQQLLHICNKYARNINFYIIELSHDIYVSREKKLIHHLYSIVNQKAPIVEQCRYL